ncbi:hypothetical protein OPT61_g4024 [Boeremia exigua]|uniref:Uncharacterized protein n=1 Tax=Boeremia exigua TaxID=749465 RepID=A0ACC2IFR6_9PLEO|nr:hypothetical protein OPT61_g4024 [Boeremia exigua]
MATGGIANVLYAAPFRFSGLYELGCFFFIGNMALWSTTTFTINQMTPIWIFPAYPLLIIGPHAGSLAPKVSDPETALQIILGGYIIQGIGFLVSLMIYAAFIYRLMTQKLPKESLRPGMFISVGPSGFTIAGIVTMGQVLPQVVPPNFMGEGNGELAGRVGMIMANFMGLWLWGLALWFFFISVGAHWSCARRGKMDFAMTWYSFVFPNTALTTATFAIGRALDGDRTINYVGCAMTIALIMMWMFVVVMNVRAVVIHQILWPQKQEDRTEGGWKQQTADEQRRRVGDGGESAVGRIVRTMLDREEGGGALPAARRSGNDELSFYRRMTPRKSMTQFRILCRHSVRVGGRQPSFIPDGSVDFKLTAT